MEKVVLVIEDSNNAQIISNWLSKSYDVVKLDAGGEQVPDLDAEFDLCILDVPSLKRIKERIQNRRSKEGEVFLPFVLLIPEKNLELKAGDIAEVIDEFLSVPIKRMDMKHKVETLLQTRRISTELERYHEPVKDVNAQLLEKLQEAERVTARKLVALKKDENTQLMEQLLEAERMAAIGQAMAEISHCIKNIIQGLNAGVFILKKDIRKANAVIPEDSLEMMDRSLDRMKMLVHDMLYCSKDREPEYATVDINAEVRSVMELMVPKAKEKGIGIELDEGLQTPDVEIDPSGIFRCVLNLVGNAIEATERNDATITLSTGPSGENDFYIAVADQGSGMDEQTKDHLFDTFYSTKGAKGTGLGLSVTHKIVKEHGGRTEVESVLDEGTTFTIVLPRKRVEDTSE